MTAVTLRSRYLLGLRHCDRWRIADMLREQPDLCREDRSEHGYMAAAIIN